MNEYIKKQFVPYEIAVLLKDLNFDESCFAIFARTEFSLSLHYNWKNSEVQPNVATAPLWQQVIDWLYEKRIAISQLPFTNRYGVAHKFQNAEESTFIGGFTKEKAILEALKLL